MRSKTVSLLLLSLFLFSPCLAQKAPPAIEAMTQTADKANVIAKKAIEQSTSGSSANVADSHELKNAHAEIDQAKVEIIRQNAFTGLSKWLDLQDYPRLDPDVIGNLQATIRHQTVSRDRFVSLFETSSDFAYSVGFVGSNTHYYYSSNGELQKVEILNQAVDLSQNAQFPGRLAAYRYPDGDLLQVKMIMSAQEDYRFAPNGDLLEYCQAGTCYRPDGKVAYYRAAFTGLEPEAAAVQTTQASESEHERSH